MQLPFKNMNVNPKGRNTSDCVVRALTLATGLPYEEVYKGLFEISLKTGYMLNEKRVEDKYLEANGFIKMKQPRKNDGSKYKINEIRLLSQASVIVIRCAHHLTCVKDGVLIDTWNCGYKTINNYYVRKEQ